MQVPPDEPDKADSSNDIRFCLTLDRDTPDEVQKDLARMEYRYATTGLVFGVVAILGGIALFLNGVLGSTSWTARFFGAESVIFDAAPGAILFIVGLFVVVTTRPKIRHHKGSNRARKRR